MKKSIRCKRDYEDDSTNIKLSSEFTYIATVSFDKVTLCSRTISVIQRSRPSLKLSFFIALRGTTSRKPSAINRRLRAEPLSGLTSPQRKPAFNFQPGSSFPIRVSPANRRHLFVFAIERFAAVCITLQNAGKR